MKSLAFPMSPPEELATIGDWWRFAVSSLTRAKASFGQGTADAAQDASFLVLGSLDLPLDELDSFRAFRITHEEKQQLFDTLRKRCVEHIPTAYVLGFTTQMGLRFNVDERVLIPRSYLGELIDNGLAPWLDNADASLSVLDLCTGSGCLAILSAYAFPNARVAASDLSHEAAAVAKSNLQLHGLDSDIRLLQGDLFAPWAKEKFDVIVSNPPYVTDESMEALPAEYRREPALALAAGADGCDVLERMLGTARTHLTDDGMLFVDVGHNRELVEMRFPHLPFNWLATEAADSGVFMLGKRDLPQ
jgi:ribosomal protein L3 glutamine methyltransferase